MRGRGGQAIERPRACRPGLSPSRLFRHCAWPSKTGLVKLRSSHRHRHETSQQAPVRRRRESSRTEQSLNLGRRSPPMDAKEPRGSRRRWKGCDIPVRRRASAKDCKTDPETGVAPGFTRCRNMRSRCRCSMCPAIHINSRSWLRSSSTHEPSDPPLRVVSCRTRGNEFQFPSCREALEEGERDRLDEPLANRCSIKTVGVWRKNRSFGASSPLDTGRVCQPARTGSLSLCDDASLARKALTRVCCAAKPSPGQAPRTTKMVTPVE